MTASDEISRPFLNPNDIRDRLTKLSSIEGITKWDLGASSSKDISVQVENGKAKQLKGSQRSSITVRVWNSEGLVGITSTSDLSDIGLSKALRGAFEASNYGDIKNSPDFSIMANTKLSVNEQKLFPAQGITKLLNLLIEAESNLINKHSSIKTVPYNGLSELFYERVYLNSDGAIRSMSQTQASLYLYARAQESDRKPRSSGSIRIARGSQQIDIDSCINEAANKTISHLNYEPISTGNYLVCFTSEAFLDLLSAFSSIFNARAILDGVSLSTRDSIGEEISVPFLSLNDNGLHHTNVSSCSFDGEGTPTNDLALIDSGKIVNFLHSEATARSFGVQPTGHAGMGAKVSVSPDWFIVSRVNDETISRPTLDHKQSQEKFILIEGLNALHSGVRASQGSFSLPFDGWLIENGQPISIESATIAGDIKLLLKKIVNIEKDQIATHQGVSPYIWVEDMKVTGDS